MMPKTSVIIPSRNETETYIYGLIDPRDSCLRYIGKSDNPKRRLKEHKIGKCRCHRTNWTSKLKALGLEPKISIIDIVPVKDWEFWEKFYITKYRGLGLKLVNGTEGGDGLHNPTEEVRRKISNSNKGKKKPPRTKEHCRKISKLKSGRICSIETRQKISQALRERKIKKETRQKLSKLLMGNKRNLGKKASEETRRKMSESQKKRWRLRKFQK